MNTGHKYLSSMQVCKAIYKH